jgi:uncharacterized membrane protein YfcA
MNVFLALAGVLIGFVAVTLGGGGGGVYIGLLTEGFHVPPAIAVSTSLATIVPTVLIGAFSHWRNGNVRLDVGWPALIGGSMGAATGGLLSSLIPAHLYMRGLGAMTLAMLLLIFLRRPKPSDQTQGRAVLGAACGLAGGILSGVAGISGSAPITVGLLLLGCTAVEAIGTSVFVLTGVSATGFLVHLHQGNVNWPLVSSLCAGSTAGAFLAPLVIVRFGKARLERVFRPAVVGISIVMGTLMLIGPNKL